MFSERQNTDSFSTEGDWTPPNLHHTRTPLSLFKTRSDCGPPRPFSSLVKSVRRKKARVRSEHASTKCRFSNVNFGQRRNAVDINLSRRRRTILIDISNDDEFQKENGITINLLSRVNSASLLFYRRTIVNNCRLIYFCRRVYLRIVALIHRLFTFCLFF